MIHWYWILLFGVPNDSLIAYQGRLLIVNTFLELDVNSLFTLWKKTPPDRKPPVWQKTACSCYAHQAIHVQQIHTKPAIILCWGKKSNIERQDVSTMRIRTSNNEKACSSELEALASWWELKVKKKFRDVIITYRFTRSTLRQFQFLRFQAHTYWISTSTSWTGVQIYLIPFLNFQVNVSFLILCTNLIHFFFRTMDDSRL